MTNLTFRNISDVETLFKLIDCCIGPVYLQSESYEKTDLRGNTAVKNLLSEACNKNGIENLNVVIHDKRDMPRVLDYLLSCKPPPENITPPNNVLQYDSLFRRITSFIGKDAKLNRVASL